MKSDQAIDFSSPAIKGNGAAALQRRIVAFVRGIRRPRQNPVSATQIKKWFRATPADFVDAQIDAAMSAGKIRIVANKLGSHRRSKGAYSYEIQQVQ